MTIDRELIDAVIETLSTDAEDLDIAAATHAAVGHDGLARLQRSDAEHRRHLIEQLEVADAT